VYFYYKKFFVSITFVHIVKMYNRIKKYRIPKYCERRVPVPIYYNSQYNEVSLVKNQSLNLIISSTYQNIFSLLYGIIFVSNTFVLFLY